MTASRAFRPTKAKRDWWQRALIVMRDDVSGLHPRLIALNLAARLLPAHAAPRARARLYALAGFRVGHGTRLQSPLKINGPSLMFTHLVIGRDCFIDADCVFDLGEKIVIGDRARLGRGVMLLTSTHELDHREHRAGPVQLSPVIIGNDAWLGAGTTILPGVEIGEGAVVEPGSVVNRNVAPWVRVGGVPALPRKTNAR